MIQLLLSYDMVLIVFIAMMVFPTIMLINTVLIALWAFINDKNRTKLPSYIEFVIYKIYTQDGQAEDLVSGLENDIVLRPIFTTLLLLSLYGIYLCVSLISALFWFVTLPIIVIFLSVLALRAFVRLVKKIVWVSKYIHTHKNKKDMEEVEFPGYNNVNTGD